MQPRFPSFRKLTIEDKNLYNQLVEAYTPFSDISFTTLHIWWNLDDKLYFSVLNNNLVLNYSQPFDRANAGWSLIGSERVDESLSELFSYLKEQGRLQKLVHVPQFTIDTIEDLSAYEISEEADMHEYVMDASAVADLEGRELGRIRRKVNRFLREVEDRDLVVKSLDLSQQVNRHKILEAIDTWQKKFPKANDPGRTESDAIKASLTHHQMLGIENLCVFVDDKLYGIALFHRSHDDKYLILNHLKVDYSLPFIFDYLTNQVALKTKKEAIPHLNMEMDLGIEGLRQHKMGLRPIHFLKKYTVINK